jgi:hypothetical protein
MDWKTFRRYQGISSFAEEQGMRRSKTQVTF